MTAPIARGGDVGGPLGQLGPLQVFGLVVHGFVILAAIWTLAVSGTSTTLIGALALFSLAIVVIWPALGLAWLVWVALTLGVRRHNLDGATILSFLVAPVIVVVTAMALTLGPDPLESAADRIRASQDPAITSVGFHHDWLDGDSLDIELVAGATRDDAKAVWCSVVRNAGVPRRAWVSLYSDSDFDLLSATDGKARSGGRVDCAAVDAT